MKKIVKIGIVPILAIILVIFVVVIKVNTKDEGINENGNNSNRGLALEYEGVTYYNKYEKGIFAVKEGGEMRLTEETAYSITASGDRLYYMTVADFNNIAIKYVDLKSGDIKNVATVYTSVSKFFVEEDWIYYFTNNGNSGICRIGTNGENEELLIEGSVYDFQVYGQKIYYLNGNHQLCEFSLQNKQNLLLHEEISAKKFQIVDKWIYYYNENENALFRLSLNGKKQGLVSILVNNEVYNVCGDYVYYLDEQNYKIARMRIKKSNQCDDIVSIDISKTRINIAGNVLYYLDKSTDESQNYQMHRVGIDGGEIQDIMY